MSTILRSFILSSMLVFGSSAWQFASASELQLTVNPQELPAGVKAQDIAPFLSQIVSLLPRKMREGLNRQVLVRFEALDSAPGVFVPPCEALDQTQSWVPQTLGKTPLDPFKDRRKVSTVVLHRGFLAEILKGERASRTYSCGHKNVYRLALATAIHELGHVYDLADPLSQDELAVIKRCDRAGYDGAPSSVEKKCKRLSSRKSVTTRPAFLNLMGWVEQGLGITGSRNHQSKVAARSPDPYELTSPEESFAVNLEYFVLDPEFACRRPALHRLYVHFMGEDPHTRDGSDRACQVRRELPLTDGAFPYAELDPRRIYQIHALLAGKGPAAMSKWGHTMYRLVICAPTRTAVGPECLSDLSSHIVLGFRAFTTEIGFNTWKGLVGDYPSILFAQTLLSVVEEYNKGEFRELVSLPLNLSEEQKELFVERALEMSWEHSGRYQFLSNNCAVEGLNFLKGVVGIGSEKNLGFYHPVTPIGVQQLLMNLGIADGSVLNDSKQAQEQGYFFASKRDEVEAAFRTLVESASLACGKKCASTIPKKLDNYLDETTAQWRAELYDALWKSPNALTRKRMGGVFFLLENYAGRRAALRLNKQLAAKMEGEFVDAAQKLQELGKAELLVNAQAGGYGIPLRSTISPSDTPESETSQIELQKKALLKRLTELAPELAAEHSKELERIRQNTAKFLKEMRSRPNGAAGPGRGD